MCGKAWCAGLFCGEGTDKGKQIINALSSWKGGK